MRVRTVDRRVRWRNTSPRSTAVRARPILVATGDVVDRELTVDELAARVGVTVRNVRAYSARGLLPAPRMVGGTGYYGREHVARLLLVREMLAAGLQVVGLGVPPDDLIDAQTRVNEHVRAMAQTYVPMFVATGWQAFVDAGAPPEQLDAVRDTVARLQPVAAQAVLAAFRTEMAAAVEAALEAALSRLEEEPGSPPVPPPADRPPPPSPGR